MQSLWLENSAEPQALPVDETRQAKAAFARKAGWIWRFSRTHRKWTKRWARFDSGSGTFTFTHSPSQAEGLAKRRSPKKLVSVSETKLVVVNSDSQKMFGFTVEFSRGRSSTICCATSSQRDGWHDFLKNCSSSEMTLDSCYDVHWQTKIGRGAYAEVVLATDRESGDPVAVKMVTQAACQRHFQLMDKEMHIMSMIGSHPYLLGLRDAFYSKDHIYLVTDLLEGGDLKRAHEQDAGPPYTEVQARRILKQILVALDRLHTLGVSHCDLKPENVLFTSRGASDGRVKLIDYNSATFFDEPTEPGGTPEYMAPELLEIRKTTSNTGWDSALDMWSVGVLLFWMLTGRTPFQAETFPEVMHNIQSGRMTWPIDNEISAEAKQLIMCLLEKEPRWRPSAEAALEHCWMKQGGKLKPLLALMADARGLQTVDASEPQVPQPRRIPSSLLDTATLAAMDACTPKHLCIRVPGQESAIRYGFAASLAPGLNASKGLGLIVQAENLQQADSLLTLSSYNEDSSPGSQDPMDSCMSLHRDLSFKRADSSSLNLPEAAG